MNGPPPDAYAFVIKIWHEPDGASGEWRGEVTDVLAGRVRYFRKLEALTDAVRSLMQRENGRVS